MPRHSIPKFSGSLAEPIYAPVIPEIGTEDDEMWRARTSGRLLGKVDLLFEHYKINATDPDCWRSLSINLAFDFVPGMRLEPSPPPRKGRKRTWRAGLGDELLAAVELTSMEHHLNVRDSIRYLTRHDPKWKVYSPQSLEVRHREAGSRRKKHKQRMAELMAGDAPRSLAEMAMVYYARVENKPQGLCELGMPCVAKSSVETDEN